MGQLRLTRHTCIVTHCTNLSLRALALPYHYPGANQLCSVSQCVCIVACLHMHMQAFC